MAEWKKLIASGSAAELAAVTASSGILVGSNSITVAGNSVLTGSFTGSFTGDGSGLSGVIATLARSASQADGIVPFNFDGTTNVTVAVSGAAELTNNKITKWDDADGKFVTSSLSDDGVIVSGISSIQLTGLNSSLTGSLNGELVGTATGSFSGSFVGAAGLTGSFEGTAVLTGSFTGSFVGDGSGLTGLVTMLDVSASSGQGISIDLKTQDLTIAGTANQITTSGSGQTITIGLPADVIIDNSLIVQGDLTVNGTTTTVNTQNLNVEDQFILLASGSIGSGTDGGIVIDNGSGTGPVLAWDGSASRWSLTGSFDSTATVATPDAYLAAVVTTDDPSYRQTGNIRVESGDIYIWVP